MDVSDDPIRDELHNAVCKAVDSHEKSLVTKWFAMVETVDEQGQRGLWSFTSEGATAWDNLGLLGFATQKEQAKLYRDLTGSGE